MNKLGIKLYSEKIIAPKIVDDDGKVLQDEQVDYRLYNPLDVKEEQLLKHLKNNGRIGVPVLETDEMIEYVICRFTDMASVTVEEILIDHCFRYVDEIERLKGIISNIEDEVVNQEGKHVEELNKRLAEKEKELLDKFNSQLKGIDVEYNELLEKYNKQLLEAHRYKERYKDSLNELDKKQSQINRLNDRLQDVEDTNNNRNKNINKLSKSIVDNIIQYRNQGLGYRTIAEMINNNKELVMEHSKKYININGEVVNGNKHKFSISHTQVKNVCDSIGLNKTVENKGRRKKTTPEIERFICNTEGTYSEIASKVYKDFGVSLTTATIGNIKRRNSNV